MSGSMSRRRNSSSDSESRKRTLGTNSRSANFHGLHGSMERVKMTRRSTASFGSSSPRDRTHGKPATKVCRNQRELRSLADSLCSAQPLQRTRTASIRAIASSENSYCNNEEVSSDEENKEERVSTISMRRMTRRISHVDCINQVQTKPSSESINGVEQAHTRRFTRSSAAEVASNENGDPPGLDSTDDESQTSSSIQNIRPILKKRSLRDRLSVFTRSSARARVVSFRDTVYKRESTESEHSSRRFPKGRQIQTRYQTRGPTKVITNSIKLCASATAVKVTRSMVRGGETIIDADEKRKASESKSMRDDDIPEPEIDGIHERSQRVSRKRLICSSLREASSEGRHLENLREVTIDKGFTRTLAKTRSLARAPDSSERSKIQAAARQSTKSEAKSTCDYESEAEFVGSKRRSRRVSHRKRSPTPYDVSQTDEVKDSASPTKPMAANRKESTHVAIKTRSMLKASNPAKTHRGAASVKNLNASEQRVASDHELDAESFDNEYRSRRVSHPRRIRTSSYSSQPDPPRTPKTSNSASSISTIANSRSRIQSSEGVETLKTIGLARMGTRRRPRLSESVKHLQVSEAKCADGSGKHRRFSLRRQSSSSGEPITVMENGSIPDVVRTRSMGRASCDEPHIKGRTIEPLKHSAEKPSFDESRKQGSRGTKRKYAEKNVVPEPGKESCRRANSGSRARRRTQSPIRYASKLVRDDDRRPVVRVMPLLMDYDSRAQKGLDHERVDFGASWEAVPEAIQRKLRQMKKPKDDPDILMDERQYKVSLRSHRRFEDQEKLIALDDENYHQSHARSFNRTGNDSDDLASRPIILTSGVRATRSTKSSIQRIERSQPPKRIIPPVKAIDPIRPESAYEALLELNHSVEFARFVNEHDKS